MTVRTFVIGGAAATVLGALIWVLVVGFLDPNQAGPTGYVLFFLSFFLTLVGGTSLLGFGLRRAVNAHRLSAYCVRTSLRQGVMLALFSTFLLVLVRVRLYQWWVAVILTILFVAFELVFLNYDRALTRRSDTAERERAR